jgi:hypothetical protein
MAFPSPRGMTPGEIEFLAEMEMVTVVPRQRLEGLELLGVSENEASNTPRQHQGTLFSIGLKRHVLRVQVNL